MEQIARDMREGTFPRKSEQTLNEEITALRSQLEKAREMLKWLDRKGGLMRRPRTAEEVLEYIATTPLRKDFEYDRFGEVVGDGWSYGPGWAAHHFQETARQWLINNGR